MFLGKSFFLCYSFCHKNNILSVFNPEFIIILLWMRFSNWPMRINSYWLFFCLLVTKIYICMHKPMFVTQSNMMFQRNERFTHKEENSSVKKSACNINITYNCFWWRSIIAEVPDQECSISSENGDFCFIQICLLIEIIIQFYMTILVFACKQLLKYIFFPANINQEN